MCDLCACHQMSETDGFLVEIPGDGLQLTQTASWNRRRATSVSLASYLARCLCASPQVKVRRSRIPWKATSSQPTRTIAVTTTICERQRTHRYMTRRRSQAVSVMTRTIYGGLSPGHRELAYLHTKRKDAARSLAISRSMRLSSPELNLSGQGAIRWGRFDRLSVHHTTVYSKRRRGRRQTRFNPIV